MDFTLREERQIAGSIVTSRKVYDETGGWAMEDGFYRMPVFVSGSGQWRPRHRPYKPACGAVEG